MTSAKWIKLTLRVVCLTTLSIVLLITAAVQLQQYLLRWRSERLMADMHQIRLYQSTWADAGKLMHRWGAWGHYDGACNSLDCRYVIEVGDQFWGMNERSKAGWLMRGISFVRGWGLFGGRLAALRATFTVHDGTIWCETARVFTLELKRSFALWLVIEFRRVRTENGDSQKCCLLASCISSLSCFAPPASFPPPFPLPRRRRKAA